MAEKKPFFVPQELQKETQPALVQPSLVTPPVSAEQVNIPAPVEQNVVPVEKKEQPYLPVINLTNLPSNFLSYPKGTEISYHPYTFGELKKFSQSKLSLKQRYEFILDGIIVNGMKKEKITFNDFLYIALLRKISSIGVHEVSVKFHCSKCNFENEHHVKLDALDFDSIEVPDLPAHLVINNKELSFTPLTVEDFFALFKEGKESDPTGIMAMQCRNKHFKEAYDIIFNANPEDSELLDELNKLFYHGLATMKIPCENKDAVVKDYIDGIEVEKNVHCGHINLLELGDPDLIVLPFRRDGRTAKDRIRFGSGDANKP